MLKAILLSSSFISLLALTTVAKATVTATVCNGCGPAALRQEALDEGDGDHYLYDFVNRKLTHYSIAGQTPQVAFPGGHSSQLSTYVTIVPIDPSTQAVFNATQNVYDVDGGSMYLIATNQAGINIPTQSSARVMNRSSSTVSGMRSMTAFDMVQVPVYRQMAINDIAKPSEAQNWPVAVRVNVGSLFNALNLIPLVKVPLVIQVVLHFPDGSTSIVEWDYTSEKFVYVKGSSKDTVGNPIPENLSEVTNGGSTTYVFPASIAGLEAGSQQIINLQKMGINIPTTVYGSSWVLACSNISGNLPHCVAMPL